jgi:hypothetical protein
MRYKVNGSAEMTDTSLVRARTSGDRCEPAAVTALWCEPA